MGTAIISDGFARESATLGRTCGERDPVRRVARADPSGLPTTWRGRAGAAVRHAY